MMPNYDPLMDSFDTWSLNLAEPNPQWQTEENFMNPRNHLSGAQSCGRYFFVGGQKMLNEQTGNQDTVTEWLPDSSTWSETTVPNLPYGVGHISASVLGYKCGLIVVGGIINGPKITDNLLWWHPSTNTWKIIGKYPHPVFTTVCGIAGDEIMCATGGSWQGWRDLVYHGQITV